MRKNNWSGEELTILKENYKKEGPKGCAKHLGINERVVKHKAGKLGLKYIPQSNEEKNKEFITKAIKIHGNKYVYDKTKYISMRKKIIITCPTHGDFTQIASSHIIHKQNCPICAKTKLNTAKLIGRFKNVHKDKYDYSKVEYTGKSCYVNIICKKHGVFSQRYDSHSKGHGCHRCSESIGETTIKNFLLCKVFKFEQQKTFNECKHIKLLPFDFYLPEFNVCIEYNGLQHYKAVDYWGGMEGLKKQKLRDKIKMEYCKNNNIPLIIIKYNDDINESLNYHFNVVYSKPLSVLKKTIC